jgi:hypothetical protein
LGEPFVAAVRNDPYLAVREQHIDEHAVVGVGVSYAPHRGE